MTSTRVVIAIFADTFGHLFYEFHKINIPHLGFHTIIIMNARPVFDIIKHVFMAHNKPPTLGRWNIHNNRETMLKIKYANEDNCGISGNSSKDTTKIQKNDVLNDNQYIYMMGYESIHD